MNLLQIPILDEFHVADPVQAKKRGSDFAAQKGLLTQGFGRRGNTHHSTLQADCNEPSGEVLDFGIIATEPTPIETASQA